MILGAVWLIATRWVLRLIGLASTMVLARLLMPEDFGVIAVVGAIVAVLDGFFDFGFNLALIRAKDPRREDYDTAWSLRAAKSATFGVAVIAVSPLVAAYAHDRHLILVSLFVGLGLVVRGFDNIGTVRFEKEMQYDRLFRVRLYPRLTGAVATLGLAFWLRSYWAIVLGGFVQQIAFTLFSYVLCDYRPRFRFKDSAAMWQFSRSIMIISISRQIYNSLDRFVLSGLVGKRELGYFSVSGSLAALVSTELIGAAGAALIPGYAKLRDQPDRLKWAFLSSQGALLTLLLPITVALALLARPFTAVVLGSQWGDAAPLLAAFMVFYMAYTLVENLNSFMAVTDLQTVAARVGVLRTLLFLALVYPVFQSGGLLGAIALKACMSLVEFLYLSVRCCRCVESPFRRYLAQAARPAVAGAAMAVAILCIRDASSRLPAAAELVLAGAGGGLVYVAVAMGLWTAAGKPAGLEPMLADAWSRWVRRRFG